MDIKEAKHHCEFGAFAAFTMAFFSSLFTTINLFVGSSENNVLFLSLQQYGLDILVLSLGIGLLYYYRIAGILLCILVLISIYYKIFILGNITSVIITSIFLYFFIRATWGAFSYHNYQKEIKNLE